MYTISTAYSNSFNMPTQPASRTKNIGIFHGSPRAGRHLNDFNALEIVIYFTLYNYCTTNRCVCQVGTENYFLAPLCLLCFLYWRVLAWLKDSVGLRTVAVLI